MPRASSYCCCMVMYCRFSSLSSLTTCVLKIPQLNFLQKLQPTMTSETPHFGKWSAVDYAFFIKWDKPCNNTAGPLTLVSVLCKSTKYIKSLLSLRLWDITALCESQYLFHDSSLTADNSLSIVHPQIFICSYINSYFLLSSTACTVVSETF